MIRMKDIISEDAHSQLPAEQCLLKQGFKYKPWNRGITKLQNTRSNVHYGKLYLVKLLTPSISVLNRSYIEVTIELSSTPMLSVYSTTNAKSVKLTWTSCNALTRVIQRLEAAHKQSIPKKKTGNDRFIGQDPNFYSGPKF